MALRRYLEASKKRQSTEPKKKKVKTETPKTAKPYAAQTKLTESNSSIHYAKYAVMDSMYWIPKKDIFNVKTVIQLLTVRPRPDSYNKNPEPFIIYREKDDLIGVPRFFGCQQFGLPTETHYEKEADMSPEANSIIQLRDTLNYPQRTASQCWIKRGGYGIICLKCGSGKTVVAIYLAVHVIRKRTLVLVHTEDLVNQWIERIQQFCTGVKVGRLQQKRNDILESDIVIGMIHSVASQDYEHLDTIGFVIVDEAHHLAARTFCRSIVKIPARKILGLSATPNRRDGLFHVVEWLLGGVVFANERHDHTPIEVEQLVYKNGDQKIIEYGPGRLGVPKMITRMAEDMKRNSYLVHLVCQIVDSTPNCKLLVLSSRLDHLDYLMRLIPDTYTKGYYTGKTSKQERALSQECQVILGTYNIAAEGLDIPGLNRMILATPSGNTEQVVGRLREDAFHTQRRLYDIVDPFSLFDGMSWKRHKIYKDLKYLVRRTTINMDDVPLLQTPLNIKKPPVRRKPRPKPSAPAPTQGTSYLQILKQTQQNRTSASESKQEKKKEEKKQNEDVVSFF